MGICAIRLRTGPPIDGAPVSFPHGLRFPLLTLRCSSVDEAINDRVVVAKLVDAVIGVPIHDLRQGDLGVRDGREPCVRRVEVPVRAVSIYLVRMTSSFSGRLPYSGSS